MADKFITLGCNTIIITLGANGVVHASKDNRKIVHSPAESVKAVDTTVNYNFLLMHLYF